MIGGLLLCSNRLSVRAKQIAGHNQTKSEKYVRMQKVCLLLSLVLLGLFAAFRNTTVGYDTPNYYDNIKTLLDKKRITKGHDFEIGYQTICFVVVMILRNAKLSFFVVNLISSAIILCNVFYASKKLCKSVELPIFLFASVDVYLRAFNQTRQGIAISFLMVALVFIVERKLLKFLITCLVATCFHTISIVFVPFYFLALIPNKYLIMGLSAIGAVVFALFDKKIVYILSKLLHLRYYDQYISNNYGIQKFSTIGYLEIVCYAMIFVFFLIYKMIYEKKYKKLDAKYNMLLLVFFFVILANVVALICKKPELYGRLIYYFFWAIIFLVPAFIDTIKDKKTKTIVVTAVIFIAIAYLGASIFIIDAYGIIPYKLIF